MRAADDRSDSTGMTSPQAYRLTSTPTSSPHHQESGGESPVLTELMPSRVVIIENRLPLLEPLPLDSGSGSSRGNLNASSGSEQAVTMFAVSPTGTPRLPEGYDGTDRYSSHQLSYQNYSYQYHVPEEGYGRAGSDSESGYHTPGSSPYSHNTSYSHHSPSALPTVVLKSDTSAEWGSANGITTDFVSKGNYITQETTPGADNSLNIQYPTDSPIYLPSTDRYSQKENDRLQTEDAVTAAQSQRDENEIYGEEDRQQIIDSLLARRSNTRLSESENLSPVQTTSASKKNSGQKKRRRRTQTPVQRKAANMRERKRMCHLNVAFDNLKSHLPNVRNNKKLSRIQTLRAAIYYIGLLTDCLHIP